MVLLLLDRCIDHVVEITTTSGQVAVNHQLVVVTESYKFKNDGKASADSLLLCSTTEFATAQAHQEVF